MIGGSDNLSNWLQAQLQINQMKPLDENQLEFIVPYIQSPLTRKELQELYILAHTIMNGDALKIAEMAASTGPLLLKLLNEQSPRTEV